MLGAGKNNCVRIFNMTLIPSKNYFHSLLFTTCHSNLYFSDTRGKAVHKTRTTGTTNFLMPRPTHKCVVVFLLPQIPVYTPSKHLHQIRVDMTLSCRHIHWSTYAQKIANH